MFKYQFERRNVDYILISPVEIKQEEIERSELEIFYNENKDLYKTDETRDFSIISLNILDISRQEDVSDNGNSNEDDIVKTVSLDAKLIKDGEEFVGHTFKGKYLDCGSMEGYIKSSMEIAIK